MALTTAVLSTHVDWHAGFCTATVNGLRGSQTRTHDHVAESAESAATNEARLALLALNAFRIFVAGRRRVYACEGCLVARTSLSDDLNLPERAGHGILTG